jgi:urease accessory protein
MAVVSPAPATALDSEIEAAVDAAGPGELASATRVDGALVVRYLGDDAARARALFVRLWRAVRLDVVGAAAVVPRIWWT